MSYAMSLRAGIGGSGLWSISRGLARDPREYKQMMDHADSPRRGDLDGRGNLSQAILRDFCEWFLSVMLDQIRFTKAAVQLETLNQRYRRLLTDLGLTSGRPTSCLPFFASASSSAATHPSS